MRVDIIKKIGFTTAVFLLLFWIFAVVTSPKKEAFYYADLMLQQSGFSLSDEGVNDYWLFCSIKGLGFSNNSNPLFKSKKATLFVLGAVNLIVLSETSADGQWKNLIPWDAKNTYILHTVFEPAKLRIFSNGAFGKANVVVSLKQKQAKLTVYPTEDVKQKIPMNLFKEENGGLVYETVF